MYLVRDIFNAKPGKAKDLVAKFKALEPYMKEMGMKGMRVSHPTKAHRQR